MEERLGSAYLVGSRDREAVSQAKVIREKMARKKEQKMSEREIEDAIRVTEERLGVLKRAVEEEKAERRLAEKASSVVIENRGGEEPVDHGGGGE